MKTLLIKKKVWIPFALLFALTVLLLIARPLATMVERNNINYVQPVGQLVIDNKSGQDLAVIEFNNTRIASYDNATGVRSSATVYGYDAKYIYARVSWDFRFGENGSRSGGTDYGRFAYEGSATDPFGPTVTSAEFQGNDNLNPSLESLFPRKIYDVAIYN